MPVWGFILSLIIFLSVCRIIESRSKKSNREGNEREQNRNAQKTVLYHKEWGTGPQSWEGVTIYRIIQAGAPRLMIECEGFNFCSKKEILAGNDCLKPNERILEKYQELFNDYMKGLSYYEQLRIRGARIES